MKKSLQICLAGLILACAGCGAESPADNAATLELTRLASIDVVRAARLEKLNGPLLSSVSDALWEQLTPALEVRIRLRQALPPAAIRQKLGVEFLQAHGTTVTARVSLLQVLSLSRNALVLSIESTQTPLRAARSSGAVSVLDELRQADFGKILGMLNARIVRGVDAALGSKGSGFVEFRPASADRTRAAVTALGVSLGAQVGEISTARFTLRQVLEMSALPGVVWMEASQPVWPAPAVTISN